MILVIILFLILLIFNINLNLEKFSEEDNKNFDKYRKFSKKIITKYGSCSYTPSYLINEIPQISWNGYFINDLFIKENFRRKGYATNLLQKIINLSKKEGKLHLISQVVEKNIGANKLHEKLGFTIYSKGLNKNNEVVLIYVYYL